MRAVLIAVENRADADGQRFVDDYDARERTHNVAPPAARGGEQPGAVAAVGPYGSASTRGGAAGADNTTRRRRLAADGLAVRNPAALRAGRRAYASRRQACA